MNAKFLEIFYCLYYNTNVTVEEVYKTVRERLIKIDPAAKIPSLKQVKEHVAKTIAKANAVAAEKEAAGAAAFDRHMTGTAAPASESEAAI